MLLMAVPLMILLKSKMQNKNTVPVSNDSQTNDSSKQSFWNERWEAKETGWDIGYPSPAISEYFSKYSEKEVAVLIPGCGNAYEAEFLVHAGFKNITLVDIAPKAVEILRKKFAGNSNVRILCADFFTIREKFDILIEQTFFCAIPPSKRKEYVRQAAEVLNPNGRIVGLLFDIMFEKEGPPFGGSREEYEQLFNPLFHLKMLPCLNSINPRAATELFIELQKK
jgi:SAM-dependent methyltransferase